MKVKCLIYHNSSKLGVFVPGKTYKLDESDERVTKMLADFPERFGEDKPKASKPKVSKPKVKKEKVKAETKVETPTES